MMDSGVLFSSPATEPRQSSPGAETAVVVLVRARREVKGRRLGNAWSCDELGKEVWVKPLSSRCEEVLESADRSYRNRRLRIGV